MYFNADDAQPKFKYSCTIFDNYRFEHNSLMLPPSLPPSFPPSPSSYSYSNRSSSNSLFSVNSDEFQRTGTRSDDSDVACNSIGTDFDSERDMLHEKEDREYAIEQQYITDQFCRHQLRSINSIVRMSSEDIAIALSSDRVSKKRKSQLIKDIQTVLATTEMSKDIANAKQRIVNFACAQEKYFKATLFGSGAIHLAGIKLKGMNFEGIDLSRAELSEADLTAANLRGANLFGANLRKANLTRAVLRESNLCRANLTNANLTSADLIDAYLINADLNNADLSGVVLDKINWMQVKCTAFIQEGECYESSDAEPDNENVDVVDSEDENELSEDGEWLGNSQNTPDWNNEKRSIAPIVLPPNYSTVMLSGSACFRDLEITNTNYSGVKFRFANFSGVSLSGVNFSRADLSNANFSGADLHRVNFNNANLSGVDFNGAYFDETDLSNAYLSGAKLARTNLNMTQLNPYVLDMLTPLSEINEIPLYLDFSHISTTFNPDNFKRPGNTSDGFVSPKIARSVSTLTLNPSIVEPQAESPKSPMVLPLVPPSKQISPSSRRIRQTTSTLLNPPELSGLPSKPPSLWQRFIAAIKTFFNFRFGRQSRY